MRQGQQRYNSGRIALVAVGANKRSVWGDTQKTVSRAISEAVSQMGGEPVISPYYATPAFPKGAGPDFVNAAFAVTTLLEPEEILAMLHQIEAAAGRTRDTRWGPRTLDLDLLAVGDAILPDEATLAHWMTLDPAQQSREAPDTLILPHPRLQDRAFVLVPLADVAPDWQHPVTGRSVVQMRDALGAEACAEVIAL